MFDNLKIGKKMMLLSGTILCLLLITLIWGIYGLSTTVNDGQRVALGNKLHADLLQLEIDHLNWTEQIAIFLNDNKATTLDVQLDHTQCAFGKWYYGEGRKRTEALLPEIRGVLQAIEEPHLKLHASAKKIKAIFGPQGEQKNISAIMKGKMQAQQIFINETQVKLKEVQKLLRQMIQIASDNIMSDQQMLSAAASTRTGISIIGIIALLAGSIIAFLISRSLTVPMRKTVSMIEELENGHLDTRLEMKRRDEIGQMATTMDRFANSLQNEIVASLQKLASGDLTFEIQPKDERDLVRGSLEQLGTDLNQIMARTLIASDQIASGSIQVSDSAQSLSQGATESAASLEEISSSMSIISEQTNQSADNASQASQLAGSAREAANTGSSRMAEMVGAMGEINEAGQNIGKIIKVIDEIAFQTNLLALNAAVEAARAGQHGKGFAVVAEEVRNLAARSAKAARETAELIEGSVEKANNGTRIAERTADSLDEIVEAIGKVTDLVAEIAAATKEQAGGVAQVNIGLQQIDQVIQQSTANAEESAATSEELSGQAAELKNQLAHFVLKTP
ncbi:MAG: HAMP domain-containing protein [Deltaproteobacteria bacterium]|nr:HAMP domain-containing protein [Deltaproteobacteria bacterium]